MRIVVNWSGVMSASWRFHRNVSFSRKGGVASGWLYAGKEGLMWYTWASEGSGRAGAGLNEGMSISSRIGIKVNGSADWAQSCLSVLEQTRMSHLPRASIYVDISPHQLRFAHPISPYPLDLNGSEDLFPQLVRQPICCMCRIFSPASQAGRPPWTLAVEIIIVVSVLCVIDCDCPSLGGS